MQTLKERVGTLNNMIQQGQIMEAFEKFYKEDCVMSDNAGEKRIGKDANREYEKQFINAVESWNKAEILSTIIDEEKQTAATEWLFDFKLKDGPQVERTQIALQHWDGDQIVEEKFYYGGN